MPRLTNSDYLQSHDMLRSIWLDHESVFGLLSSRHQRLLHRFFVPAQRLSDQHLLQHRRDITTRWPSLPQRAGRALAHLERLATTPTLNPAPAAATVDGRRLVVRAIRRPELDTRLLAKALLAVATAEIVRRDQDAAPPHDA